MAILFHPVIFRSFPDVAAGMTLRRPGVGRFGFNLSHAVGESPEVVEENRLRVTHEMGFADRQLALQRQVHGTAISTVHEGYLPGESDALVCAEPGWLLGVSVADCVPVLVYDSRHRVVAGVHSGWRGTERGVLPRTLAYMTQEYNSNPNDLHLFIGPAASACCYEIGEDVASRFAARYSRRVSADKFHFDNKGCVLDQALLAGVHAGRIELDPRCTICDENFHSYRRDGTGSGRMLALIGLRGEKTLFDKAPRGTAPPEPA